MQLNGKNLVEWLEGIKPKKAFPNYGKVNYVQKYFSIKEFLDNGIHPEVSGMTLVYDDDIYLTKHGTDHIDVVIQKLSELVDTNVQNDVDLTPYEVYLLLVATQLHDSGHIIKGRAAHEKNAAKVMGLLGNVLGTETVEKKMIWTIAEAHGGRRKDGKKDKIDLLPVEETIFGLKVRPRVLAALLRLADELSDDYSRASKVLMDGKILKKESEIFHQYASVLHTVNIDHLGKEIRLEFSLNRSQVSTKYGKGSKDGKPLEFYLIDEIYERLYKMYMEFIYCMRFIPFRNKLDTISAKITFIDSDELTDFLSPISIKLSEKGYPEIKASSLFELCPDELYKDGNPIDGEFLNHSLK